MTVQNNKQFLDDQPHGHLQDGSAKAFERIERAFPFLTIYEQHQLVDRTFKLLFGCCVLLFNCFLFLAHDASTSQCSKHHLSLTKCHDE